MTSVFGSIRRGRTRQRIALEVNGKLTKLDWERFKAELQQVFKKYGINFGDLQITTSKKKKRKKKRTG